MKNKHLFTYVNNEKKVLNIKKFKSKERYNRCCMVVVSPCCEKSE